MDTTPFVRYPQLKRTDHAMCLQNTTPTSLKNRGKRVHFADEPTRVAVVERRSEEERTRSFLTSRELKSFQLGTLQSVEAARADMFDDKNHCLRGIEHFTSTLIQRNIRAEKKMLNEMVFAEQERQKLAGIKDDVSIQELSEMCTTYAKNRAFEAAAIDAAAVDRDSPRKRKRVAVEMIEPLSPQSHIIKNAFAVIFPEKTKTRTFSFDTSTPDDGYLKNQRITIYDEPPLKRSRIECNEQRDQKVALFMNQRMATSA